MLDYTVMSKRAQRFVVVVTWSFVAFTLLTVLAADNPLAPPTEFSQPLGRLAPLKNGPGRASPEPDEVSRPETEAATGVIVGTDMTHDVSQPLRDVTPPPDRPVTSIREMGEPGQTREEEGRVIRPGPPVEDPVVQRSFGGAPNSPTSLGMPTPLNSFEGVNNIDGVYPPDTNGDVGPEHYVQIVNLHFQIFDKKGNSVFGPASNNTLWQGFGAPCETRNDGDPIVLYDALADRWLLSQFTAAAPYGECVAVSVNGDPTGAYYRYFFQFSTTVFYDYPKLGVWPDGYYLSANRFGGNMFLGASAIVLDRASMLDGQAATFQEFQTTSTYGALMPADLDGVNLPPAGSPDFFAEIGATALHLWSFHVDWATPANSTFAGPTSLTVAAWNQLCANTRNCLPQPGTSQRLDAIGDRLMNRLVYRNFGDRQSLVVNHTVDAGSGQAGVRWYEIRDAGSGWSIYQQGTYAPAGTESRWMGSIAMDHDGNLALGYSVSSSSVYPSIHYTGRLVSDPLGDMSQGEATLIAGSGSQTGSAARWGDYSMMTVDPIDDCTFWYTTEYLQTTGTAPWRTRIGSFKFPSCSLGPRGTLAGTVLDASNGNPIVGARVQAAGSLITQTGSTTSGAGGMYSMLLPVGIYTVTASAYGYLPITITDVSIVSGTTTTQDIALIPAAFYVVSGTVKDATTGWPLYASIGIAGYPGGAIWNDPVSGFYSVTLAEGVTYTFNVRAWAPGYDTASRSIGPLTNHQTENFALTVNPATCNAPGYSVVGGLVENFDSVTPPALPAGWAAVDITRTSGNWATSANTVHPFGQPAHSPPNLAYFNSFTASNGNSTRLYRTTGVNMTTLSTTTLYLWIYHDTGSIGKTDRVQVQVSINGGGSWNNAGAPITRADGSIGWKRHTVDLSAYSAATDLRLGILGISAFGNDVHMDDVSLGAACVPQAGGLVVGNVYDASTFAPLAGATIANDSGRVITTVTTPDPAVPDSFYTLFSPAGAHVFTATQASYGTVVTTTNVVQSDTVRQDFYLPSAHLIYSPSSLRAVLRPGTSTTKPFTVTNAGALPLDFIIYETPGALSDRGGGPDAFGYTWYTATFQWIDATGGTALNLLDDSEASVNIPFSFPFYISTSTRLRVGNNGAALYNAATGDVSSSNVAVIGAPNFFIAPFWDDIDSDTGNVYWTIVGSAPNRQLVVEWYNRPHYNNIGAATFEMALYENGNILVQYQDVDFGNASFNNGASATVGIRGPNAANSLQYSFNTPGVQNNSAICFQRPGAPPCEVTDVPWLSETPTSMIGLIGSQGVTVTFDASAVGGPGVYRATLVLANTSLQSLMAVPVTMTVTESTDVYSVTLNPVEASLSGDAGATVTYTLGVTNTGSTTDTFMVTTMGNAWPTTVPGTIGPLASGAGVNLIVTVDIPAGALGGATDSTTVLVASQGDPSQWASATLMTTANALYGVILAPSTVVQFGDAGTTVTYTLRMTNTGVVTDTFTLDYSGSNWEVGLPVTSAMLMAGEGMDVMVYVTIPVTATGGMTDTTYLTATGKGVSDTSTLITTIGGFKVYLPLVLKD